jgi:hypothetical protein
MIMTRHLILLIVFSVFLLTPIVQAEDVNEEAYQNRFSLKAGTVLNNEQKGEWRGIGDCLIFPYYDARQLDGKQQSTIIKIKNIGEYGIVAKLRFREWSRGREIFSKDIWIPSSSLSDDVAWQGAIESNADGTNVVMTSFNDVVYRNDTKYFYLSDTLSSGLPFSTRNIRKNIGESTLYGFIEVIGEEKTSPEYTNGKVPRLAKIERDCPNTLLGKVFIQRWDEGISMAYDAMAIGNFSRGQGSLFISPGNAYPRLDTCEDSLDQLEFQLSKSEIYAPYTVNPLNEEKTSLIIAYPTKFFHYQNGSRIDQVNNPFEAMGEITGETIEIALSEQGQEFADSSLILPYSVNVIGLYKDYREKPFGIDNVPMQTYSSDLGEVTLASDNLSQKLLIPDYEYYKEGRFMMYRGLPAVGLVLQESRASGQLNATISPVEFSTHWVASVVETISTPAPPSGPVSGVPDTNYTYTAIGGISSLGHPIEYLFDWGDGTNSDWLPVGITSASKAWTTGGTFNVSVRARCAYSTDVLSKWSNGLLVTIETVYPPTVLTGPTGGIPDQSYSYTANGAYSNAGHSLEYQFDWQGDGATDLSPWGSSTQSKTWSVGGVYTVRARARCATHTDVISSWSNGLLVSIGIETVSTPTTPTGPSFGVVNKDEKYPFDKSYSFTTGGSSSILNHPVEYQFDWKGDGSDLSTWGPFIQSKTWTQGGVYTVRARARCVTHTDIVSNWSSGLVVTIESVTSPNTLSGPTTGIANALYTYSTGGAVSSLGHSVQYLFDWGDGTNSDWLPVGTTTATKSWSAGMKDSYLVKTRARCATNTLAVSDWTPTLKVAIEYIATPKTPVGPEKGIPGDTFTYATGDAFSNIGHSVEYQFDWKGDGFSDLSPWGSATQSKTWATGGTYSVRARARCVTDTSVVSDWSSALTVNIEKISTPTTPTQQPSGDGIPGISYTYSTGGATSNIGDPVQYLFHFGDGTESGWLAVGVTSFSKSWYYGGTYTVMVKARCAIHTNLESDWSGALTVKIEMISTPTAPTVTGPTPLPPPWVRGTTYTFSTGGSTSNVGHPIQYMFEWGDGTYSNWIDAGTGGTITATKAWTAQGDYVVRALARCKTHPNVISDYSVGLTANIP